ncbi:MAG: glutaredoxin domain-containing protein [Patescibacteria group bacterium]
MVTIYTKNSCPYCIKAKALLDFLNVTYKEVDITNTPEKVQELSQRSGFLTVPQIFVGENEERCLGGFSDIDKLNQEGKLLELVK